MDNNLNILLQKATISLAAFLEKVLPSLFNDWWNEAVINILSFQQRRHVKERGINSLTSLDFAALLRVLDPHTHFPIMVAAPAVVQIDKPVSGTGRCIQ